MGSGNSSCPSGGMQGHPETMDPGDSREDRSALGGARALGYSGPDALVHRCHALLLKAYFLKKCWEGFLKAIKLRCRKGEQGLSAEEHESPDSHSGPGELEPGRGRGISAY